MSVVPNESEMAPTLVVRGHRPTRDQLVAYLISVGLSVGAAVLSDYLRRPITAWAFALSTVVLLLLLPFNILLYLVAYRTARVRHDRLDLSSRCEASTILDVDVLSVSRQPLATLPPLPFRRPTQLHELILWHSDRPSAPVRRTSLHTRCLEGDADPLQVYGDRLLHQVLERAKREFKAGELVRSGWRIDRSSLVITRGSRIVTIARDDLASVECYEGHVCLWVRQQAEPVVRLPLLQRDAQLLGALCRELVQKSASDTTLDVAAVSSLPETCGLGRRIHVRQDGSLLGVLLLALSLAACLIAGWVLVRGAPANVPVVPSLVVLGTIAIVSLLQGWRLLPLRLEIYELGLVYRAGGRSRTLHFDDVTACRLSNRGSSARTLFTGRCFRWDVRGEQQGRPVAISWMFGGPFSRDSMLMPYGLVLSQEITPCLDFVAARLAARWLRQLDAGETVLWTHSLSLHPDGLIARQHRWLGQSPSEFVPYSALGPIVAQSESVLIQRSDGTHLGRVRKSQWNAQAGVIALLDRVARATEAATGKAEREGRRSDAATIAADDV